MDGTDIEILEIFGPWNNPELALDVAERAKRVRARFAFRQMCFAFSESRIAASVGFQSGRGARTESKASSLEMIDAEHLLLGRKAKASAEVRADLEYRVDTWHRYLKTHAALAENGASIAVNTVDRIVREFAGRAAIPGNIVGGPVVGTFGTTMLELIRAGGNWSRHRGEWGRDRLKWDDHHKNRSVRVLSRCMIYHLDDNVFSQILDKLPYETWIELEEAVQRITRSLVHFAFEPPYLSTREDDLF